MGLQLHGHVVVQCACAVGWGRSSQFQGHSAPRERPPGRDRSLLSATWTVRLRYKCWQLRSCASTWTCKLLASDVGSRTLGIWCKLALHLHMLSLRRAVQCIHLLEVG